MKEVTKSLKNLGEFISKNSPTILTALGCTGLVSTSVLTGRAVPKAIYILENKSKKKSEPLTFLEKVQLTWKCYIPAGMVGLTSIACIIGANTVNTKRNAALAALYSLSESAFRDYKTKVIEEFGKNKEQKVRDEVARERVANNPPEANTIIVTGNGDILCYDALSDRYFTSSYETIRQKVNDLNYDLISEMWISLNEFYDALGLPPTKLGDMMGFDIEKGKIVVNYSTQLSPNGNPCLVIDTTVHPRYYD